MTIMNALLQVQATILASSKQTGCPTKTREIANEFARRLIRHAAELKKKNMSVMEWFSMY